MPQAPWPCIGALLATIGCACSAFYLTSTTRADSSVSSLLLSTTRNFFVPTSPLPDCSCTGPCVPRAPDPAAAEEEDSFPGTGGDATPYACVTAENRTEEEEGRTTYSNYECVGADLKRPAAQPGDGKLVSACSVVVGRYDCWSFPCKNGGFCVDEQDGYKCICADQKWWGRDCDTDFNECTELEGDDAVCAPSSCGGICSNTVGGYQCSCRRGWAGNGYAVGKPVPVPPGGVASGCGDVDDCASHPCHNGGTCYDPGQATQADDGAVGLGSVNQFYCSCADGWIGRTCHADIDECRGGGHDCVKEAECRNNPGSFNCVCGREYAGDGHDSTMRPGATGCTPAPDVYRRRIRR